MSMPGVIKLFSGKKTYRNCRLQERKSPIHEVYYHTTSDWKDAIKKWREMYRDSFDTFYIHFAPHIMRGKE